MVNKCSCINLIENAKFVSLPYCIPCLSLRFEFTWWVLIKQLFYLIFTPTKLNQKNTLWLMVFGCTCNCSVKLNVDYLNHCLYPLVISIVCNKCLIINCENFFKKRRPCICFVREYKSKKRIWNICYKWKYELINGWNITCPYTYILLVYL